MLPASPQQNRIAERRIGLVMELNLWPRVSLAETSPTLRWTGEVGDASVFRVWGSRAFVCDTSADKLSAHAIPCVFLGFVPDAPGWQFYHPTSRRVLPSQDVTFDESVPFYRLFPYHSAPSPPLPLFLAPGPPLVDPLQPQGPAPSGVSQVDPLPGTAPFQVAVVSGAAPGTASGGVASGGAASGGAEPGGAGSEGAGSGGAEPAGVEPGGAESEGAEPGGAESEGAESGGAEPRGAALFGGPAGASLRLSSQQLREWLVQRAHRRSGAPRAGESGVTGAGGASVTTVAGDPTEPGAAGAEGAGAGVAGVGGPGAGGAGAARAGAVDPGAGGAGGIVRPRSYFDPLLQQVLGVPSSTGLPPPFLCPPPDQSQPPLQPASPVPVPSPYTEQSGGLIECREPASRPVLPVHTARRVPRSRPPLVPGTHTMALPRAASPTVARLLATTITDPSFDSAAASALVAELLDFAAACHLDYASSLVAESVPASPPSVGGECALGTYVLEDMQRDFECLAAPVPRFASMLLAPEGDPDAPDIPTPCSYAEAITGPYSSQWQAAMDAKMASWKSTGTYVDEVPPPEVNKVDGRWIFRVKRLPGSPPTFKARYVARGFRQRQGVDFFQTFSPTPKMTTLRVLLHVAAQRDYELHFLDFSTAFLQGSLHEEIWLRRPPGFTGSFPAGTQWSLRRPVYDLRQAPREWHDTLRTTLAALGFSPSTADPSLFLRTDTSLPPFYVLVYVDDLVFATADTEALTLVESELHKRHTCTDLGELRSYLGLQITWDRARRTITLTQSHIVHQVLQRFGFQYSSPQLTPLSTSHSLSAPPSDESVEPSGPYPQLVGCLITLGMGLVLGGRGPVVLASHADASWVDDSATQRSSQGYTFSLGSGSVSWRSTRSVSQVDLLPNTVLVEVAVGSGAASWVAASGSAEPGRAESEGAGSWGVEPGGAEPGGAELGGAEPEGVEPGGAESEGAESGGAEPRGIASSGGAGVFATGDTASRGVGVTAGAGGAGGSAPPCLEGARTKGTGAALTGCVGGARAGGAGGGDPVEPGGAGAGGTRVGGAGAGGAGSGDTRAVGAGARGTSAGGAGAGGAGARDPGTVDPELEALEWGVLCLAVLRQEALCDRNRSSFYLPAVPDPESDLARAASPTVSRLLATVVTDPSFKSTVASALVAELVDFAAACRLDNATTLEDFECLAAAVPRFASMLLAPEGDPALLHRGDYGSLLLSVAMDTKMASYKSTSTYVDAVPPSRANIVVDTSLPPFYILVYVDDLVFPTADTEALTLVKSELQKRHTCTDLGELRNDLGLQITRDRARRTIIVTQSHMVHHVLQHFGFTFTSPHPTPLSTGHSLSAPPSDESIEPSGPYPELVGCLMYLMTCTRPYLAYPLSLLARYVAPDRHRKVHWDVAKRGLLYLCITSGMGLVLGGWGPSPAKIQAMAAQELRWLIYLLTDLGEEPRLPPVLYVDNKAMIALCQEHRLEHRTKHNTLRYFLARELQQRGQLRLAYVATRANTADVFTKAHPPRDHQRFSTVLGLVPTLPHLLTA
ncbi:unnamed protein product [Closterium sp. NIES-54]